MTNAPCVASPCPPDESPRTRRRGRTMSPNTTTREGPRGALLNTSRVGLCLLCSPRPWFLKTERRAWFAGGAAIVRRVGAVSRADDGETESGCPCRPIGDSREQGQGRPITRVSLLSARVGSTSAQLPAPSCVSAAPPCCGTPQLRQMGLPVKSMSASDCGSLANMVAKKNGTRTSNPRAVGSSGGAGRSSPTAASAASDTSEVPQSRPWR